MSIWLSKAEIDALPDSGPEWRELVVIANGVFDSPNLTLRNYHGVECYAAALVYVRTGFATYKNKLMAEFHKTTNASIDMDDALDACRSLGIYAIALSTAGIDPAPYRDWFRAELNRKYTGGGGGGSIISIHERRPNNWGGHAFASRVAVDLFIGDVPDLQRAVQVHKGFLGDRTAYAGFTYDDDLSWHFDESRPVGINPAGATMISHRADIDGVIPDDQRRADPFRWPPPKENYVYECLQGLITGTVLLCRNGYPDAHLWSDSAIKRAYRWLYQVCNFPAEGDDRFQIDLLHYLYGDEVAFAALPAIPYQMGKAMGFTDWSHRGRRLSVTPPTPVDPCTAVRAELLAAQQRAEALANEANALQRIINTVRAAVNN